MNASLSALLIAAATLAAASAHAQQAVYRIVGPDGKVTFSDKPPANADQGKVTGTGVGATGAASASSLPYELRQVVGRFPVMLYTSADCAPCVSGRALLIGRGIPFNERTIGTTEDQAALTRIGGDTTLPLLTVGTQKVRGYSSEEWAQYLDLAGYPKTSALPAGYRNAPAAPLVSSQAAAPKPRVEDAPVINTPPPQQGPTPSNPAGIQF